MQKIFERDNRLPGNPGNLPVEILVQLCSSECSEFDCSGSFIILSKGNYIISNMTSTIEMNFNDIQKVFILSSEEETNLFNNFNISKLLG